MHRRQSQRFQDQHLQCSLNQVCRLVGHKKCSSPLDSLEVTGSPLDCQEERTKKMLNWLAPCDPSHAEGIPLTPPAIPDHAHHPICCVVELSRAATSGLPVIHQEQCRDEKIGVSSQDT